MGHDSDMMICRKKIFVFFYNSMFEFTTENSWNVFWLSSFNSCENVRLHRFTRFKILKRLIRVSSLGYNGKHLKIIIYSTLSNIVQRISKKEIFFKNYLSIFYNRNILKKWLKHFFVLKLKGVSCILYVLDILKVNCHITLKE